MSKIKKPKQQTTAPVVQQAVQKTTNKSKIGTANGQRNAAQAAATKSTTTGAQAASTLAPQRYAQMLKDYLARGGQTVQLQPGQTATQAAKKAQQQTLSQPSVREQLIQQYYATEAQATQPTRDAIAKAGGWANLTADDVQNMVSKDVYTPADGEDKNLGVMEYFWNSENQQATRNAYANQQADIEMASQYGVFDQPEYLLGGYSQYATDEYLKQLSARLPLLQRMEQMRVLNEKQLELAANEERLLVGSTKNDEIMGMTQSDMTGAEIAQEYPMDDETVQHAIEKLLNFDNAANGTERNADYLNDLSDEERGNEMRRLAAQYKEYVYDDRKGKAAEAYPYDFVQDLVNSELNARDQTAQYIEPMINDPDFVEKSQAMGGTASVTQALMDVGYTPEGFLDSLRGEYQDEMRQQMANNLLNPNTDGMIYWIVNGELSPTAPGMIPTLANYASSGYDLMTPTEVAVFNYHYNSGDKEKAFAYLDSMSDTLQRRARAVEQAEWEFLATDNLFSGSLAAVASVGASLVNPIVSAADMANEFITGEKSAVANPASAFGTTVRTAQEQLMGEIDPLQFNIVGKTPLQHIYSAGMSGADMAAAIGMGALTGIPSLGIMAAESAAGEWNEQLETDNQLWERVLRTGIAGGATALTEQLPLDIISGKTGMKGWQRILGAAGSEAAEEFVEEEVGNLADWAFAKGKGEKTPKEQQVELYRAMGVEHPELAVAGEYAEKSFAAAIAGGLSGGALAGASETINASSEADVGRQVRRAGGVENLVKIGAAMKEGSESRKIASTIQQVAEGKKVSSRKLGQLYSALVKETTEKYRGEVQQIAQDAVEEQIAEAYENVGVKTSKNATAKMLAKMIVEGDEKTVEATVQQETTNKKAEALVKLVNSRNYAKAKPVAMDMSKTLKSGENVSGKAVAKLMDMVRKYANGSTITFMERKMAKFDAEAEIPIKIMNQFKAGEEGWTQDMAQQKLQASVRHAVQLADIQATTQKPVQTEGTKQAAAMPMDDKQQMAQSTDAGTIADSTQERVEELTRRKNPKDKASKVVTYSDRGPEKTATFKAIAKDGSDISIVMEKDGEEVTVAIDDVKQVSAPVARVIAYAEGKPEITAVEMNEMIAATEQTDGKVSASEVIAAYEMGVQAGYVSADKPLLQDVAKNVGANTEAGKAIAGVLEMGYKTGSAEAGEAEAKRRSTTGTGRGQYVGVSYMGEVENANTVEDTGVRETTETLKKTLTPAQFASVQALEKISEVSKINFVLYRTKAQTGEQLETPSGVFDPSTSTIYLDIDAGKNVAGETMTESAMLKVASHELTHYIEKHSADGYAQLRAAMKEQLAAKGVDYYTLITNKLRQNTHVKTRAQAEAEVIADAAEMMLKDSNAVKMLAQRSPGLFSTIKNWLKDFVRRIKRAFSGVMATSKEAQALVDNAEKYLGDLQDIWDNALVEAASGKQGEGETVTKEEEAGNKQYAIKQTSDGKQYVEESRTVISGTSPEAWRKQIINYINNEIRQGKNVVVYANDGTPLTITRDTAGKAAFRNKVQLADGSVRDMTDEEYAVKLRAEGHIDELAQVSTAKQKTIPDKGNHKFAKDGFSYRTAYWKDATGYYRLTISVGENGIVNTVYNVGKIEKAQFPVPNKGRGGSKAQDGNQANGSVTQNANAVKQLSTRNQQTNTQEFKKWFGDSVVRNEDGSPKVMYHQTGADFTVFNTKTEGAGTRDNVTPFGIFMKQNDRDIGLNGKKQMALYAKIENPLSVQNREALVRELERISPQYASIRRKAQEIDREYSAKVKAAQKAFTDYLVQLRNAEKESGATPKTRKELYEDPDFLRVFDAEDAIVDEWTETAKANDIMAKEIITAALKEAGYDGVILREDVGSWGRKTEAYIALEPTQVKSATDNVGTFDPNNPDIRYSERRGKRDLSVRDALMAITDMTGMTHAEAALLSRYQANNLKLEEVNEAIAEQKEIRDSKETPEKERGKAKQELWKLWRQKYAIERALIDAENGEGYAKLMSTAGEMVRLLTTKDTLPEVTQALQEQIAEVDRQLVQVQEKLGEKSEEDMWNTIHSLFDQKKLRTAAKKLKALYGSRITEKQLMNSIVLMQTTLLQGGKNASENYMKLGEDLVRELRSKGQQDNEMLSVLKEYIGTITLTEAQRQEINGTIGMKEFLSVVRPVVKVVPKGKGGTTLDVLLDKYNTSEGGYNPLLPYFEGYEGEGDSIMHLYDLIKKAKTANPYAGRYGQEQLKVDLIDVMGIASEATLVDAGVDTVKKVMDALIENAEGSDELTAKVHKLRAEMAKAGRVASATAYKADERHKAMADVIDYLKTLEMQNMLMEKQDAQRVIERQVKEQSNERIRAIIDEKNMMERNRVMRERIKRTVGWMVTRIRRETDRKNVPQELKPYIEDAIRIFAEYNDVLRVFKKSEVADIKRIFEELKKYDLKSDSALNDLIEQELGDAFKELRVQLDEYAAAAKGKDSKKKTMYRNKSLQTIDEIVEMLWGQIRKWNEIFIDGKQVQLSSVAEETAAGLKAKKTYAIRDNLGGKLWEAVKEGARNKNLTPIYFFRLLKGNNVLETLNEDIVKAQSEYGVMVAEAKSRIEQIQADNHYWVWKNADPLEFTTEQGKRTKDGLHNISLTVDEAMSIWAIWKREQDTTPLFESTHLANGGFVLQEGKRKINGKLVQDNTPHKLEKADIDVIDKWLTAEQKAYAEAVVKYMSTDMADVGNRASQRMYGIKKYKEEHYFPMSVQKDQMAQSSNKAAKNPEANRIAGAGFSHRRVERAWKPLTIGSFTEVAANHVNEMLLYGTFAVPIESFNSVLNYNYVKNAAGENVTDGDESSMTIRALFRQKYGDDLTRYLENYLADLNGGTGVKENNKLMSLYKRSAVMASVSVAIQQPLSVIRAWMVQNPKYYLKAMGKNAAAPDHKEWEQLRRYSGVAVLKGIGGFDMTSTRTMGGYLAGTAEDAYSLAKKAGALVGMNVKGERFAGAKRQFENLLGLAAQKADQMAWVYMWRAAKAETAEKNPGMNTSSEEFLQLAAERFEEVVNLTQVYDSTLVRSQNMRSKSNWDKAVTAFMAEPTLTWNMLMDGWNTGNKKAIVKAAGIFLLSQVIQAAVKSLWTAGRKEDEEKPWLEKYLNTVGGELGGWGGSLNVLNLIPYARDVMSLIEGYDVERADVTLIDQLVDEVKKWQSGKYENNPEIGAKNMAFALANLMGVPVKNIWRDVTTGINTWKDITQERRDVNTMVLKHDALSNFSNFMPWVDVSDAAYYTKLYTAMKEGDAEEAESLQEFLTVQGKSEKTIRSGVKTVVKGLYKAGKLTDEEAKQQLVELGLAKDQKEAYKAVDEWKEKPEKGEPGYEEYESYSVYNTVREAIDGGNSTEVKAAIEELKENGYTEAQVQSEIYSYAKEQYAAGEMTYEQAQKIAKQYAGKADWDKDDWYWEKKAWDYLKSNGTSEGYKKYGDFLKAVETGKNLKTTINEYLSHGVDKSTLSNQITTAYRKQYVALMKAGRKTEAANLQARILTAYEALGYDRQKKLKDIQKWLDE